MVSCPFGLFIAALVDFEEVRTVLEPLTSILYLPRFLRLCIFFWGARQLRRELLVKQAQGLVDPGEVNNFISSTLQRATLATVRNSFPPRFSVCSSCGYENELNRRENLLLYLPPPPFLFFLTLDVRHSGKKDIRTHVQLLWYLRGEILPQSCSIYRES